MKFETPATPITANLSPRSKFPREPAAAAATIDAMGAASPRALSRFQWQTPRGHHRLLLVERNHQSSSPTRNPHRLVLQPPSRLHLTPACSRPSPSRAPGRDEASTIQVHARLADSGSYAGTALTSSSASGSRAGCSTKCRSGPSPASTPLSLGSRSAGKLMRRGACLGSLGKKGCQPLSSVTVASVLPAYLCGCQARGAVALSWLV